MNFEKIMMNERAELQAYCLDNTQELRVKARPTILIFPGGAYQFCSDREAESVALAFNSYGYNAFVLRYTTKKGYKEAYHDGKEAFKYLYENKEKYSISKLLVCGFSAGAHLACSVSVRYPHKPDGMILIYPPLLQEEWRTMCPDAIDLLDKIDEKTPKAFIVHAYDDPIVPVHNAYMLMKELDIHGVEFEAHVYRSGGHGFSIASKAVGGGFKEYEENRKNSWVSLCMSWIKEGIGDIVFK